MSTLTIKLMFE